MSVKLDRLGSDFSKVISKILATEVKDKTLTQVTITGCEITNDLSFAKVYYTVFNMEQKKEVEKSLEKAKSFIRGEISKRIQIRHTPELRFYFDESIEYGNKIERIIQDINNKE